jgi:hypothetical protein
MHERVLAAIAALTLVLVGLLGRGHEAAVAHVEDGSGRLVHAENDEGLAAHDRDSDATHIHEHSPDGHADSGACSLLAVAHQVAIATPFIDAVPLVHEQVAVAIVVASSTRTVAQYRLAPKTSPPLAG